MFERSNLTPRQLLIYAGQRLYPGVLLYDAACVVHWPGLDPVRFERAWQHLYQASDALRLCFEELEGVPQQRVLPAGPCPIERVSLPAVAAAGATAEAALSRWLEQRLQQPIDIGRRVFDTALLQLAGGGYAWYLNVHHLVADGAALELIVHRLHRAYVDDSGAAMTLPAFMTSVAQQRRRCILPAYAAAREYWQRQLARVSPPAPLFGLDGTRSMRQQRVVLRLDKALTAALESVVAARDPAAPSYDAAAANLFTAVLAAFLLRVGGGDSVVIGTTWHHRQNETERQTIGLFLQILPLRLHLDATETLQTLMARVAQLAAEARRNGDYDVPNPAQAPVYGALLNYMRPSVALSEPLRMERLHAGHGGHGLSLSISPPAHGVDWELWLDLHQELALAIGSERIAAQFRTLLASAVCSPGAALATLPLIPAEEQAALRAAGDGPVLDIGTAAGGCHAAFELQAARTPDAAALHAENAVISYRELNSRANRLAHALRARGLGSGSRMGICIGRSPEMIVALLAVLKSGAAYVPLDPAYPRARLEFMLQEAAPALVLSSRELAQRLPAAVPTVFVDMSAELNAPDHDPGVRLGGQDLAYVMFTSGSTGRPKGVMVTHAGVINYLAWRSSFFPLHADDRSLQKASLSFDDSVWEILEPLSVGACLVLASPAREYDVDYLIGLMREQRITATCFVPSMLRALVEATGFAQCRTLRRMTTGGEPLTQELQRRILERLPNLALYNGYGTTETTIASTFWRCGDSAEAGSFPIGRPIANTRVRVLDGSGRLVPHGVIGEIYIGGRGVARGYFERHDLTQQRFLAQLPDGAPGPWYRTGDLGRWRADGVLEFIGRADEQVKIRGVRIELSEIEAVLLDHEAVRAAAVVVVEDGAGVRRLRAVCVPRAGTVPEPAALRAHLQTRLPVALLPSEIRLLEALPLMPSGKIDRQALAALAAETEAEVGYCAPRNELESKLVRIWEQFLPQRPIGVRDDFFALGGYSLLAARLAVAIERACARRVPPVLLFEAPNIEQLAQRLAAAAPPEGALLRQMSQGPNPPLILIHQLAGDLIRYGELVSQLGGCRAVFGIQAAGLADYAAPLTTIESMAERYLAELRRVQPHGPYLLAGHSAGGLIAYEMAQRLHAAGEPIALLVMIDADAHMARPVTWHTRLPYLLNALTTWLSPRWRGGFAVEATRAGWMSALGLINDPLAAVEHGAGHAADPVAAGIEQAVSAYMPRPYPGAVTVLRARLRTARTFSRSLSWRGLALGGLRVIDVPGGHLSMMLPGAVEELARQLIQCLQAVPVASSA